MFRVDGLTSPDLHQWLHEGWGYFRDPESKELRMAYFGHVSTDGPKGTVSMYETPFTYKTVRMSYAKNEVYCHWPVGGAINVPEEGFSMAVVMDRITERQYRRTYHHRLIRLNIPRQWEVLKKHGQVVHNIHPNSPNVVWGAFFSTPYPSARQAMQWIAAGTHVSVAISPTLILIGDPTSVFVYDKMKHVGHIQNGRAFITHEDPYVAKRVEKYINGKLEGF